MNINKKYSYGGYDPESPKIKEKKEELQKLLAQVEHARKTLYYHLTLLKDLLKEGKIDEQTFKARKAWYEEEVRKWQVAYKTCKDQFGVMKKGFKNESFLTVPVTEFNHTEIIGSCFSQREPVTNVFPPQMTGVTFTNCNLDNVRLPFGNTVNGGTHKQIKAQNDGEYWVVDAGLPIEPLHPKRYDKYGLSKDPKDLPTKPLAEDIIVTAEKNYKKQERKAFIIDVANNPAELQKIIDSGRLI